MGTVNRAEKALVIWPLLISLTSSTTPCVTPTILATVTFLPLFKHTKLISTFWALHFLFLLPEVIFPQLFLWPSSSFLSSLPLSATPQRGFPCPPCLNEQHLFFPCFLFRHSIDHFLQLACIHICLPLLSPVSEWKHYDDFVDHWWIPST